MLGFKLDILPFDATDALAIACADAVRMKETKITLNMNEKNRTPLQNEILTNWKNNKKNSKKGIFNFSSLLK